MAGEIRYGTTHVIQSDVFDLGLLSKGDVDWNFLQLE